MKPYNAIVLAVRIAAGFGAALGSLMKSSMQALLVPLACMLLIFASGVFYPITVLPTWLQSLAQTFPIYWVGLGVRSAMLVLAEAVQAAGGVRARPALGFTGTLRPCAASF